MKSLLSYLELLDRQCKALAGKGQGRGYARGVRALGTQIPPGPLFPPAP